MVKINFKQLKYMIPAGILPFLLLLGYQIIELTTTDYDAASESKVETEEVNTAMPNVDVDKLGIKSKYQSMISNYGRVTDRTGVVSIEREEQEEKGAEIKSAYSDREKQMLDSVNAQREAEQKELKEQLEKLKAISDPNSEARVNVSDERIQDNEMTDQLTKQMRLMQKVMNGEEVLTEEEQRQREKQREIAAIKKQVLDSIARIEAPLEVNKATDSNEQFFNSIKDGNERPGMIRARVDEMLKVKDGSRIRIRLNEDVEIGGEILPKGSCLFATVTGFTTQRVKANVSQILVGGHIRKVDLSVYDIDCIEGFYVPNNSFRELVKDVGAGAMNMNVNMNSSSGDNGVEGVALQSLQQAFQTTTQALSKHIRKNKAKIKFNTEIYLVNSKDILD